jgi:hypothetical protein
MILIGSRALAFRAPYLLNRQPKDFDWFCTAEEFDYWISEQTNQSKIISVSSPSVNKRVVRGETNCEFEIISPNTSSELMNQLVISDPETLETPVGLIPSLDLLFTIKKSHRYRKNSPHFWKNLSDYHLMKSVGCQVRPEYATFLKLREKETYTYSTPKLNVSKRDFFADDGISYTYDHDSIHESVKHLDRPAYTYFQKDGAEVACDKNKFFTCSREIQLYSVVEESAVLAIERSMIPFPDRVNPERSWKISFSKVCTSISSGWWREFAYENAMDCLKLYPHDYWDKFQKGLTTGVVKPFNPLAQLTY